MNIHPNPTPRILIVSRWEEVIAIARLPRALKRAGFAVAALCTEESFLAQTRYLDRRFSCPRRHHRLLDAFFSAVTAWKPDLIVPGNDWDRAFLQRIANAPLLRMADSFLPGLSELLERSVGNPDMFETLESKASQQILAAQLGISTPEDQIVFRDEDALVYAERSGYPVVLKRDLESGGNGVWICSDESELTAALRLAQASAAEPAVPWNPRSALKRVVHDALLVPRLNPSPNLTIQRFIAGRNVVHNLVAMHGKVVGEVTVEILCKHPDPTGPCSVVRPIQVDGIRQAAASLIAAMRFSGFGCFDFIIDEQTGRPVLIEFNAIPTNVAHLGEELGDDLCGKLHAHMTGAASRKRVRAAGRGRPVALFPQELRRDPRSPHVSRAFHDVPLDDPALLQAFQRHYHLRMPASDRAVRPATS